MANCRPWLDRLSLSALRMMASSISSSLIFSDMLLGRLVLMGFVFGAAFALDDPVPAFP